MVLRTLRPSSFSFSSHLLVSLLSSLVLLDRGARLENKSAPHSSVNFPPRLGGTNFFIVHVGPSYYCALFIYSFRIFPLIQTRKHLLFLPISFPSLSFLSKSSQPNKAYVMSRTLRPSPFFIVSRCQVRVKEWVMRASLESEDPPPFSIGSPPRWGRIIFTIHVSPTYYYTLFSFSFSIFSLIQTREISFFPSYFFPFPPLPLKIPQPNISVSKWDGKTNLINTWIDDT